MWPQCAQMILWLAALLLTTFQPSRCWDGSSESDYYQMLFHEVIEGQVECENFTFYIVDGHDSTITLNLTSLSGDCDLYVRQALQPGEHPPNPTVETQSYDLASTTCGQDVLYISRHVVRPFAIGIYAHPSHHQCTYRLEISAAPAERHQFENELEWSDHDQPNNVPIEEATATTASIQRQQHQKQSRQKSNRSKGNSDFDSIIELLISIAIQFMGFVFEILV